MSPPVWSRAGRGRLLLALSVLHLMCHALLTLLVPLVLCLQADFRQAGVEPITALGTWLAVTFALASLVAGVLADRLPGRPLAGLGLALQGTALIGLSQAAGLPSARAWIVVAGVGASTYHPVAARQLVQLFPDAVGKAFGLAAIGGGLGFWLGPRFAGWRAEQLGWVAPTWSGAAWRPPVLEAGLAALVVAALYLLCCGEPPVPAREGGAGSTERRAMAAVLLATVGLLALVLVPRDFGGLGLDSLNALFLQRSAGLGTADTGRILAARGLLSLVANPLLTWLSDRGPRLGWWAGTQIVAVACAMLVPWLSPRGAELAIVLHGVSILAGYPILESALGERIPARLRGRATAVILGIVGLAAALAPKLVGGWVDALGAEPRLEAGRFVGLYLGLSGVMLLSLLAVPLLGAVSRRADHYDSVAN